MQGYLVQKDGVLFFDPLCKECDIACEKKVRIVPFALHQNEKPVV